MNGSSAKHNRKDVHPKKMLRRGSMYISALLYPDTNQSRLLIAAMVVMALSLAFFTYAGQENRKLVLYSPRVVPVMAITSISPFLVANTPFMLKSRRTSALCILEWIHCLAAMFHHIFERSFLVAVAGFIFPFYAILMQFIKEIDYESNQRLGRRSSLCHIIPSEVTSKIDRVVVASVFLYFLLWKCFGPIFILSGAGPMTVLAPFIRHKMYASDYINFGLLGFLFFAENLCIIRGAMVHGQILHFVSHLAISYVFYKINVNHFFVTLSGETKVALDNVEDLSYVDEFNMIDQLYQSSTVYDDSRDSNIDPSSTDSRSNALLSADILT